MLKESNGSVRFALERTRRRKAENRVHANDIELQAARRIQRKLFPAVTPALPGFDIAGIACPAEATGGDYFDYVPMLQGGLGVVIGDATDKGVSAALLMATTCTMLRTAAQRATSPREVLTQVNDLLYANIPSGMFATCFYAILDPESGRLRYANAGHEWPYRRYSEGVSELQATGMPLGMMLTFSHNFG